MIPDAWQENALRSDAKYTLLNCTRQGGKSQETAWDVAHGAVFRPKTNTILIAPTFRQSKEIFGKVIEVFRGVNAKTVEDNNLSVKLANGSRVITLPGDGDNIRGYTAHRVVADEFAFIAPNAKVVPAIRPMLATTNGQFKALTTPNGRTGQFYEWWMNGGPEYRRIHVTADACPRISKEFLAQERKALGESLFRQEYYGEFMDTIDGVFMSDYTRAAISPDVKPLFVEKHFDVRVLF